MATFEAFALQCAAGIAVEVLAGVASLESGVRPNVVRHGDRVTVVASAGEGVAAVVGHADRGAEVGIGMFGLTERQLKSAGVSIAEAFEPCPAMRAAERVFHEASQEAMRKGLIGKGVERTAIRAWWRPDGRFRSSETYEAAVRLQMSGAAVIAAQDIGSLPKRAEMKAEAVKSEQPRAVVRVQSAPAAAGQEPPCWDVFARVRFGKQC